MFFSQVATRLCSPISASLSPEHLPGGRGSPSWWCRGQGLLHRPSLKSLTHTAQAEARQYPDPAVPTPGSQSISLAARGQARVPLLLLWHCPYPRLHTCCLQGFQGSKPAQLPPQVHPAPFALIPWQPGTGLRW